MTFPTKRSAKKTVQRFRLRSTSDPLPSWLPPPTPKAPDRPASLPECMRINAIRMIEKKTCVALKKACTVSSLAAEFVELAQEFHSLGLQFRVRLAPIRIRQPSHPVVELRVADLAVLRLLRGFERRAAVVVDVRELLPLAQWAQDEHRNDPRKHDRRQHEFHQRSRLRSLGGRK